MVFRVRITNGDPQGKVSLPLGLTGLTSPPSPHRRTRWVRSPETDRTTSFAPDASQTRSRGTYVGDKIPVRSLDRREQPHRYRRPWFHESRGAEYPEVHWDRRRDGSEVIGETQPDLRGAPVPSRGHGPNVSGYRLHTQGPPRISGKGIPSLGVDRDTVRTHLTKGRTGERRQVANVNEGTT